jgi:hypothetical protein
MWWSANSIAWNPMTTIALHNVGFKALDKVWNRKRKRTVHSDNTPRLVTKENNSEQDCTVKKSSGSCCGEREEGKGCLYVQVWMNDVQ